jgi:hypothetical protein
VNHDGDAFSPEGAEHENDGAAGMDMRAYAWIVANLYAMSNISGSMLAYLTKPFPDDVARQHAQYVRDCRDLWDRYRHLIAIYETISAALSVSFRSRFGTWQSAFLESGAGDDPIDRARHYQAHMTA